MRAFIVLGFPYQAERLAWEMCPKWPMLCRVGRKTTTQSETDASRFVPAASTSITGRQLWFFNLADVKPFCYGTKYFLFYQAKSYTPFRRTYSLSLAIFWT